MTIIEIVHYWIAYFNEFENEWSLNYMILCRKEMENEFFLKGLWRESPFKFYQAWSQGAYWLVFYQYKGKENWLEMMIQSQSEQTCVHLNPSWPSACFQLLDFEGGGLDVSCPQPSSVSRVGETKTPPSPLPYCPGRLHYLVSGALLWTDLDLLPLPLPSTSEIPIQGSRSGNFCLLLCTFSEAAFLPHKFI